MNPRILILGTGLIGSSLGLALKSLRLNAPNAPAFHGTILGFDTNPAELATALRLGAIDEALPSREAALIAGLADIYVLATPVLPILDWLERLAPILGPGQFVTDVGSTKHTVAQRAAPLYNGPGQPRFLPGHPMAGKESGGAAHAESTLFRGATWLFTPLGTAPIPGRTPATDPKDQPPTQAATADPASHSDHDPTFQPGQPSLEATFRAWVTALGANIRDLDPARHDVLCAWVSHLPQLLSTALASLLQETFADDPGGRALVHAIGGRALRETTRLGASPFSMWRDIALTNTEPVAATLYALEQQLAHLRENLRTPELRKAFATANTFREPNPSRHP